MTPGKAWHQRLLAAEHIAALVVAFAICAIVVRYTGDTDLLLAIGSGVGGGALAYLAARLHLRRL